MWTTPKRFTKVIKNLNSNCKKTEIVLSRRLGFHSLSSYLLYVKVNPFFLCSFISFSMSNNKLASEEGDWKKKFKCVMIVDICMQMSIFFSAASSPLSYLSLCNFHLKVWHFNYIRYAFQSVKKCMKMNFLCVFCHRMERKKENFHTLKNTWIYFFSRIFFSTLCVCS